MPPRTITADAQLRSPLFRLPRELRDQIYEAAYHHEVGLHYDYSSGKMIYISADGETQLFSLALSYTCKRLAEESIKFALVANVITFTPGLSKISRRHFHGLDSIAGRYQCFLRYAFMMKVDILRHAAECLTPPILDEIVRAYPRSSFYFREPLRAAATGQDGGLWRLQCIVDSDCANPIAGSFRDALDYALQLAKASDTTKFEKAAAKAFEDDASVGARLRRRGTLWRPPLVPSSLRILLSLKVPLWTIPTIEDLMAWEAYLTAPRRNVRDLDLVSRSLNTKWYFSAAAVAIDFLEDVGIKFPMKKIVLHENRESVGDPHRHMLGLLPHVAGSKLAVERHIDVFEAMFPLDWVGIDRSEDTLSHYIFGSDILYAFVLWFEESLTLPQTMEIVLVKGPESSAVWDFVKQAASMQVAMMKYLEEGKFPMPSLFDEQDYDAHQYPLPCFLPPWFASVVRDIIGGRSIIRVEDDSGDTRDAEQIFHARHDWAIENWRDEWLHDFNCKSFNVPEGWVEGLKNYEIDPAFNDSPECRKHGHEHLFRNTERGAREERE